MGYLAAVRAICALVSSQLIPNASSVPAGTKLPATYLIKDLPKGFVAMTIKTGSDPMAMFSPYMFQGVANSADMATLYDLLTVSYTSGQSVSSEGVDYLVAYVPNLFRIARTSPTERPNLLEVAVDLTYIRKDKIVSYGPREDLNPDVLKGTSATATMMSQSAAKSVMVSNLKQLALGVMIYSSDYDDQYPYVTSTADVQEVVFPYTKNREIWETKNPNGGRILYNVKLGGTSAAATPTAPSETVMFYDEKPWPDGTRAVSYADGHAKFVPNAEFLNQMALYRPGPKKGRPIRITGPRMFPAVQESAGTSTPIPPQSAGRAGGG